MGKIYRLQVLVQLLALLSCAVLSAVFFCRKESFWYGLFFLLSGGILFFLFYRFLDRSKRDLKDFLLSFDLEEFNPNRTNKMLRHSKDDLNFAYHKLVETLEKRILNHTEKLHLLESCFDQLQTGMMVVNDFDEIIRINATAKALLYHAEVKNMAGLLRLNPSLASALQNIGEKGERLVSFTMENEQMEILVSVDSLIQEEHPLRIISFTNIKRVLLEKELEAWTVLLSQLETRFPEEFSLLRKPLAAFTSPPDLSPEKLSVSELFDAQLTRWKRNHPKSESILQFSLSNPDLWIFADRKGMEEVLSGLIENAFDAVKEKNPAEILLRGELGLDGNVQIIVKDNGEGIGKEISPLVFVPFFTTRKERQGLGLSQIRKFMNRSGGSADLLSSPESGSTIVLRFGLS